MNKEITDQVVQNLRDILGLIHADLQKEITSKRRRVLRDVAQHVGDAKTLILVAYAADSTEHLEEAAQHVTEAKKLLVPDKSCSSN